MASDHSPTSYAWLDASLTRTLSDIVLGCVLLGAAAAAIFGAGDVGNWSRLGPGYFPSGVGKLLAGAGLILLVRGALVGTPPPPRWTLTALAVGVAVIAALNLAAWIWGSGLSALALLFGPAEFTMQMVLVLAVAAALARLSLARAVGMALLGLLLATIGTDIATGTSRFTMGFEQLADGIMFPVLVLGLIVLADALLGLLSPSFLLATYAQRIAGWIGPRVPMLAATGIRLAAVLGIVAAGYYAFELNRATWDVGVFVAFGLFGLLCKIFGWNRLVLILAFYYGPILEEQIRRSLLISRGDPATFLWRPISGTFLALAIAVLALAAIVSLWRWLRWRRLAGSQS